MIIWNRYGHECSRIWKLSANFTLIQCMKIGARFFEPSYIGNDFFRVVSSIIQSNSRSLRDLKGYLPRRKKNIVSMSEEIWSNFKIAICVKQANTMTFITIGFRVSVVSDVRERVRDLVSPLSFMLRRSSLSRVSKCATRNVFTMCRNQTYIHQYVKIRED